MSPWSEVLCGAQPQILRYSDLMKSWTVGLRWFAFFGGMQLHFCAYEMLSLSERMNMRVNRPHGCNRFASNPYLNQQQRNVHWSRSHGKWGGVSWGVRTFNEVPRVESGVGPIPAIQFLYRFPSHMFPYLHKFWRAAFSHFPKHVSQFPNQLAREFLNQVRFWTEYEVEVEVE